jgi:hypothetical protein
MGGAAAGTFMTLAVLGATRTAAAESTLVVLARPATNEANANEVLNRARGELVADGFNVLLIDSVAEADRTATLARTGRESGAAVTAGLFVEDNATTIELCLVDAITGRVLVRRVEVQATSAEQAPKVLARRTVDLLRASLLDFLVESLRSVVSERRAPPISSPPSGGSEKTATSGWAIEAGLAVLVGLEGVRPAVVPLLRVRFAVSQAFLLRATGAWFGTQPRVEAATGSASVEQGMALLDCVAPFWQRSWLRPHVSVGAGAYFVGVNGSGVSPHPGEHSSEFAFALDAGIGDAIPIGSRFEVVLEAHALVASPGIAIRFLDTDAARIGRPTLMATITLAGRI